MKDLGLVVPEKKIFYVFPIASLWELMTPGHDWQDLYRGPLNIFYIQNMKALGLVVSEKKIFYVFPMTPPGRGPYGPQGHVWQDI